MIITEEEIKKSKNEKQKMLLENLPFIISEAKKHAQRYGLDIEDLISAGIEGFLKALEKYDKNRNVKITTYAKFYMVNEWNKIFVHEKIPVTYPHNYVKKSKLDEINKLANPVYFDKRVNNEEDNVDLYNFFPDSSVNIEEEIIKEDFQEFIHNILNEVLDEREKYIIHSRFFENKTLKEVGEELNLSRERVRQLENRALAKLRNYILKNKIFVGEKIK